MMGDFVHRIADEKTVLDVKIQKLEAFLAGGQ
jgi:hypothetical protein